MGRPACSAVAFVCFVLATPSVCIAAPASPPPSTSIPMKKDSGVFVVPVSVNGLVTIDCVVDSGASDVNVPTSVFRKLLGAGSIQESDFIGIKEYTLADGSTQRGRVIRIKSLKVGNVVVTNVLASVGGDASNDLLGQSFLERFPSWSLDNIRHALVLVGPPRGAPTLASPRVASGPRPADGPSSVSNSGGDANQPPDQSIVAQTSGGHAHHHGAPWATPPREPSDGELTAQHSR